MILNLPLNGSGNKEKERIVAAFSLLLIWAKFFDWLKLFDKTAFYVLLLNRTIKEVLDFLVLFVVTLAMLGSSMFMLQYNKGYNN